MPKKLVAHTGMDAMTHAIEAYVSTANCDYTDALALHAMKMIRTILLVHITKIWKERCNAQCTVSCRYGIL